MNYKDLAQEYVDRLLEVIEEYAEYLRERRIRSNRREAVELFGAAEAIRSYQGWSCDGSCDDPNKTGCKGRKLDYCPCPCHRPTDASGDSHGG